MAEGGVRYDAHGRNPYPRRCHRAVQASPRPPQGLDGTTVDSFLQSARTSDYTNKTLRVIICVFVALFLPSSSSGLDIGLWQPLARGASESENPLAPPKTCNDPNVFAAGIYDFTREVANFCTLGLYITKNKYGFTSPSEFCRFPVKIMAAYEALKKNTGPSGQWKINYGGPNWPDSLKKACGTAGT